MGCLGLACLVAELGFVILGFSKDSLNLLDKALAQHLRVFNQVEAHRRRFVAKYERVLVLTQLGKQGADLKVHFALIARFVHFGGQNLLDRENSGQLSA